MLPSWSNKMGATSDVVLWRRTFMHSVHVGPLGCQTQGMTQVLPVDSLPQCCVPAGCWLIVLIVLSKSCWLWLASVQHQDVSLLVQVAAEH